MASRTNRYERAIDNTIATWKRRKASTLERLRGGSSVPFMQRITPKQMENLQSLALSGNQSAEEAYRAAVASTLQLEEETRPR